MAVKYHLSEKGRPNICRATIRCPLTTEDGKPAPHFETKEEAREYFEKTQDNDAVHKGLSKKTLKKDNQDIEPLKKKRGRPRKEETINSDNDNSKSEKTNLLDDFEDDNEVNLDDIEPDFDEVLSVEDDVDFNFDDLDDDNTSAYSNSDECDQCGETDFSVRMRKDPYEEEKGEIVWRLLCDNCYEDLQNSY